MAGGGRAIDCYWMNRENRSVSTDHRHRDTPDFRAKREGAAMPFILCADFTMFPDDTVLGPSFTLAAMDFQGHPWGACVVCELDC